MNHPLLRNSCANGAESAFESLLFWARNRRNSGRHDGKKFFAGDATTLAVQRAELAKVDIRNAGVAVCSCELRTEFGNGAEEGADEKINSSNRIFHTDCPSFT